MKLFDTLRNYSEEYKIIVSVLEKTAIEVKERRLKLSSFISDTEQKIKELEQQIVDESKKCDEDIHNMIY